MEDRAVTPHLAHWTKRPLNLDVLGTICSYLTQYPDLLSLSLACSVFRPLAIRTMLRSRPVVLKNIATIVKFSDFVFSDAEARMPHLVALVIDVAEGETNIDQESRERAIETLVRILKHAPSLKSLSLLSSANECARPLGYLDDHRLSAAVGEMASLRELTMGGPTEVADFLGAVRSPLTKLVVRFPNPAGGVGDSEWSPTSLGAALARISSSLKSLVIEESDVRLTKDATGSSMPMLTQFHALRSLTLTQLTAVPHLPLFLELLPNLDGTLHLGVKEAYYRIPDWARQDGRDSFFRSAREENGRAQERRCWRRLERLICEIETLFILNLRCPVGLTIINECPNAPGSYPRPYLVESLRDHPSTRLNLHVTPRWDDGFDEYSLGGIIPPEAAATLTHLTLCIKYAYGGTHSQDPALSLRLSPAARKLWEGAEIRWDDVWRDTLLPVIEHLHALTHFRLVFHCDAEASEPVRPITEELLVGDLRPMSRLGRFDFIAVASAIADALPSLRYCFVTNSARVAKSRLVCGVYTNDVVERWRESHGWRVAHVPMADTCATRKELVELRDGEAETITESEGLVLSTEEKHSVGWD